MDKQRYQDVVRQLPESVEVPLNYVKRFLLEDKAVVMVGAGFSKNAIMDEQTSMKDWNALGEEFYKKIHGKHPSMKDVRFLSVTRLAQQVEAVFHRNELETCIKQSLPDELIMPGELHTSLMKLNWHDVFTTNYDTLLERAAQESGKRYTVVTNKETLLYQSSPRIIKLHGSFPNITPFVITEEDFRKYPQMFPEFVNTVRQSLIENVFCLIGFSGDDPNFLSWEGWLRDIMGSRVSSVYMIDWRPEVPMAELELLRQRNISLINLADYKNFNSRQDAFEFVFDYLKDDKGGNGENKNTFYYGYFKLKDEDPSKVNKALSGKREEYKEWLLLPEYKWEDFTEEQKNDNYFSNACEKWTDEQKLNFLYELDWRRETAMIPRFPDWYIDTLNLFEDDSEERSDDIRKKISILRISLLGIYREFGNDEKFIEVFSKLAKEDKKLWDGMMIDKFFYISCLWDIEHLDFDKAKDHLEQWKVSFSNYRGVLWKSAILKEIGMDSEALSILQDAYDWIKNRILNTDGDKSVIQSYKSLIENQIKRFTPDVFANDNEVIEVYKSILEKIKRTDIVRYETLQGNQIKYEHGFGIDAIVTHVKVSSKAKSTEDDVYEYRLIKLFEKVGIPMTFIYSDSFVSLGTMLKTFPIFALRMALRTKRKGIMEKVLKRDNLSKLDAHTVRCLIDEIFSGLDKNPDKFSRKIRIEALSYLMVKSSREQRKRYFELLVNLFYDDDDAYSKKFLALLYTNMSSDEIKQVVLPQIFSRPLKLRQRNESIQLPDLYRDVLKDTLLPNDAIVNMVAGLNDKNKEIVELSKTYTYYAYLTKLTPEKEKEIRAVIGKWMVENPMKDTYLYPEILFNNKNDGNIDIAVVSDKMVKNFIDRDFAADNKTDFLRDFRDTLSNLSDIGMFLSNDAVELIITKVVDFLTSNKSFFIKNFEDRHLPIFDLHNDVDGILSCLSRLLGVLNNKVRNGFSKDKLQPLYDVICEYDEHNIATLPLKIRINSIKRIDKDSILREKAFKDVFSKEDNLRNAAFFAISLLADKRMDMQGELTKLTSKASHYNGASFYLRILSVIVKKNSVKETRYKDIQYVLECLYNDAFDRNISEIEKMDAIHGACILAGSCSQNNAMQEYKNIAPIVEKWRKYSEDEDNFNDVRFGFEQGAKSYF